MKKIIAGIGDFKIKIEMLYNNFFSATYRMYCRYYEENKAKNMAAMFIGVHLAGLSFLIFAIIKYVFHFDPRIPKSAKPIIFLIYAFVYIFLPVKYYSKNNRTKELINKYESKYTATQRWWWGIFCLTFLLAEWIIAPIVLNLSIQK